MLIQDSNILPMQLECYTSISQWFKSCTSQNYFRLSFVASVPAKIFFAFNVTPLPKNTLIPSQVS